jgi:hypothetical protein
MLGIAKLNEVTFDSRFAAVFGDGCKERNGAFFFSMLSPQD